MDQPTLQYTKDQSGSNIGKRQTSCVPQASSSQCTSEPKWVGHTNNGHTPPLCQTWHGVCNGLEVDEKRKEYTKRKKEGRRSTKWEDEEGEYVPPCCHVCQMQLPTPIAHTCFESIYKVIIHAQISLSLTPICVQEPLCCGLLSFTYYLVGISPRFWCLSLRHDLNGTLPLSTCLWTLLPNRTSSIGSMSTQVSYFQMNNSFVKPSFLTYRKLMQGCKSKITKREWFKWMWMCNLCLCLKFSYCERVCALRNGDMCKSLQA